GNDASQRSSAKRRPVHSRMHATRNPLGGEDGSKRQAASQRLSDRDHIRQHTVVLISKVASGAAEAALNLVEHKQRAALFGQPRGEFKKLSIDRTDPAFSLNGLDTHGTDAGIKFPLQVVEVIELDEIHPRHERNERSPIFRLTRRGKRAEGASMKRILHGKDTPLRLASVAIIHLRKGADELERSFPGLAAAVAKEGAVKPGDLCQQPRKFRLILVKKKIRNMNQPPRLA